VGLVIIARSGSVFDFTMISHFSPSGLRGCARA
jgi:hypothetical protein